MLLAAPSAHVPIDVLRRDWARTLDAAHVIGHRYIVVPWLPEQDRRGLDDYKRMADEFNRLGAEAKRTGIRLAYHNHDSELVPVDGRLPYDILLAGMVPALVAFELDLMWIAKGRRDPLAYFRRHPGRLRTRLRLRKPATATSRTASSPSSERFAAQRRRSGVSWYYCQRCRTHQPTSDYSHDYSSRAQS